MSSWFSRTTSSSQAQFAATAIVSGVVVAGAILGYQHVRRQEKVEDLKSSIPELGKGHIADKVCFNPRVEEGRHVGWRLREDTDRRSEAYGFWGCFTVCGLE